MFPMYSRVEYMLCADSYMQMHILFCIRARILILNMISVYLSFVLQMAIVSDIFMNGKRSVSGVWDQTP